MNRMKQLFTRSRRYDELSEAIREHLDEKIADLMDRGMTREQAESAARREFGNVTRIEERSREVWQWPILESILIDLRFAFRQLYRSPGFAAVAMLTLALGIGTSIAIFAFVDAALLEPLPYANPSRIMSVNETDTELPGWPLSYPDFLDWQAQNKSFSSLDIYTGVGYLLRTSSGTEAVKGERVSGRFFQTLGVSPMLGRDFDPGEDRPGGPNVVLLSYEAWTNRFGARREVVGQTIDLDNQPYTIIGVLPQSFSFALSGSAEFWVPINTLSPHEHSRTFYAFLGIGRLRDGITVQSARAEMRTISKQLQQQYAITGHDLNASVAPFSEVVIGDVRPILLMLFGGASLLLLIACVNVSSLVLVRSESRRHEIAVRGALGAAPARLARQFVTEGLLLAGLGSGIGIIVATALMRLLARLVPKDMVSRMPFPNGIGLSAHTAAFAGTTALLAALLLATTPTLRLSLQSVRDGLTDGDRGAASRIWRRLGANLVVIELAIAVVLLTGAGLFGRSLYRLLHVPLGFDANHLATVEVAAPGSVYKTKEQAVELYREIAQRVASLPGVESAGLTSRLPVGCNCPTDGIQIVGRPDHGEHNEVNERHVSASYLATLKATLMRGRFFTEADDTSHPGVAIINQALARKYFPGVDPIGQRIADDEGGQPSVWQIVGVIDDIREGPLDDDIAPTEYFPISQTNELSFTLVARSSQDANVLLPVLVSRLHQISPDLGVSDEATLSEKIGTTQAALLHRFSAWLVGGFAITALVLGVVGLYGVIAYSVGQRTREIGVRIALGAQPGSVYRLVVRQAGWLTLTGLAIGLLCSLGTSMLMRGLLFDVHAWDPVTLLCVVGLLGAASIVASFLPARRAASVDPVEALRAE
jgi:macrolide transport system ATP-binding/permease protein